MATLAEMLQKAGTLEKAEEIARFFSDDDPKYLLDLQLVLSAQGKFEESWEVSCKASEIFPNDHRVAFNRGWLVMRQGNLQKGFELMERGRFAQIWGNLPLPSNKPQWKGENIKGKALLLYCEAGYGDEIVYSKFISLLVEKGAKIIVACDLGFMSLFSRIKNITAIIDKRVAVAVYHDYWVPSMSLPKICNTTYETLPSKPHLRASPEYITKWKEIIKNKDKALKVGIRWAGNPQFEYDQHRSIPALELVDTLSEVEKVKLYSLQRDNNLVYLPDNVTDLSQKLETWEDTAAIIKCLDLVITSCTAVAHLSASLGKPTWVMIPIMPYYVWVLPGETTPWYQTVKLFRQTVFGKWTDVINNVQKALSVKRGEEKET